MSLNFNEICRVCLRTSDNTSNIFSSYYAKRNTLYSEMLTNCTKIKLHDGDGLPKLICKNCIKQLKRAYAFNKLCETSDAKLRSILNIHINSGKCETSDVKDEKDDVKFELTVTENGGITSGDNFQENKDDIKEDIKSEPYENNDDFWDSEPLREIDIDQSKLDEIEGLNLEVESKPKKKRGRQKTVLDGETVTSSKLPHQCDICGKFLSTKSNLKAHKICHTDLRPYKCSTCPASFRGYSALYQHNKSHSGETPYHCEYCPKQFRRRTGLVNHIRVHTGEKLFNCEICFKNFTQSAQLSIHKKRHKGDKLFLCQDCGKGFPIKSDLKVHQRTHNGERPYACHLCTKTFATSGNLSIHVRIHNKDVRYHCKECSRGFVTCSAYRVHLKRHKGQRDYHCECGKTFYTSSALKQHKLVHTGEKRYQCKICDRKFSQTGHLSRHYKKDHAKPNAPVPPSEHYKLVVPSQNSNKGNFNLFNIPKLTTERCANSNVKCEVP